MSEPTRLTQVPLYVTPQQRAELKALAKRTRIPQQTFLREAVANLLKMGPAYATDRASRSTFRRQLRVR